MSCNLLMIRDYENNKLLRQNTVAAKQVPCKSCTSGEIDEAFLRHLVSEETEINYPKFIIKRELLLKTKFIILEAIKEMWKLLAYKDSTKTSTLAKDFNL